MKKSMCLLLVLAFIAGSMPAFASAPFEIVSEFSNEKNTGVVVKRNKGFLEDYNLYASYGNEEQLYEVKKLSSKEIQSEKEIVFNTKEDGKVKLFALDENLSPVEDYYSYLDYSTVMGQLKKANDYWIGQKNNVEYTSNPWEVAVFHTGNMQAYYMTGDELYRNYSTRWANAHSWQSYRYPAGNTTHADNLCCFRTYIDLYNIDSENANLDCVKQLTDALVTSTRVNYWNWIDAFYMAGPIFTKMYKLTGEEKYLDKMYNMIKYTAENLRCYDREEGLWFRDASFVGSTSENGEKVFWSRGDGWVYAAFAQIIEELPDSYEHKDYFVEIFLEMSKALKYAQCENGAWHESLLDKNYNPDCEESGTGFFVYGMLWGINNGYLDEKEYFPCASKGWRWLTQVAMQENGSIGYVQAIGAQPTKAKLTATTTQHYAYANFVYAASEMAKYLGGMQGDVVPYLQKKLLGTIEVYKKDASYAIKNGEIMESNLNCEEIIVPEGMYLYRYEDLYILSEYIKPFNKTEENLLKVLSSILDTGKFPERAYTNPDRITIVGGGKPVEIIKPEGEKIEITLSSITVSQIPEPQNGPSNLIDGNTSTRWAARVADRSEPCWAVFDLGQVCSVHQIGLSFNNGTTRKTEFEVWVSIDGEEYTPAIEKTSSSGATHAVEYYEMGQEARYVKLFGYGSNAENSEGRLWFSPTEVEFYKKAD